VQRLPPVRSLAPAGRQSPAQRAHGDAPHTGRAALLAPDMLSPWKITVKMPLTCNFAGDGD
jgi:hypothetical protein